MGNLALKQSGIGTLLNGNKSYGIVTGTISGLRISNVSGAYFIDNCSALLPYSGCRVRFKDSGGKYFDCVMGLRGTGETFTDIITGDNSTFASDTGWWSKAGGASIGSGVVTIPVSGRIYKASGIISTRGLYLHSVNFLSGIAIYVYTGYVSELVRHKTIGVCSGYYTSDGTGFGIVNASTEATIDDVTLKKVLTPSNQGLLLTAAPTVDSGFIYTGTYGLPISYTYEIWS